MKYVIDTNRILAGLLKDGKTREIIYSDLFEFVTPEFAIDEIKKHIKYLSAKAKLTEKEILLLLELLLSKIEVISKEESIPYLDYSMHIMKKIDEKDSEFIACCLATNADGIFTEDKHFDQQTEVKVFKTKDLISMMT